MVVARDHPLTLHKGKIPKEVLGKYTQIVLTDRSELSAGRELGVMSPTTWRLADLFAKHNFILNGLGWGGMPLHAVRKDLEEGRLVMLPIEDVPPGGLNVPMSAVWQGGAEAKCTRRTGRVRQRACHALERALGLPQACRCHRSSPASSSGPQKPIRCADGRTGGVIS